MIYLDTSALVKLVIEEAESSALVQALEQAASGPLVSSEIASIELHRAARRSAASDTAADRAGDVLAELDLVRMDPQVIDLAGRLEPPTLRSLDAIHLASALVLEGGPSEFIAYDRRLNMAANAAGLKTSAPGAP